MAAERAEINVDEPTRKDFVQQAIDRLHQDADYRIPHVIATSMTADERQEALDARRDQIKAVAATCVGDDAATSAAGRIIEGLITLGPNENEGEVPDLNPHTHPLNGAEYFLPAQGAELSHLDVSHHRELLLRRLDDTEFRTPIGTLYRDDRD